MAFAVENFITNENLDNSKYVKFVAFLFSYDPDTEVFSFDPLPFGPCTDEDFEGFY